MNWSFPISQSPISSLCGTDFSQDEEDSNNFPHVTESVSLEIGLKRTKTIYLIRHAESQENHRQSSFVRSVGKLGKLSLPTKEDVARSVELLDMKAQVDSNVSNVGERQIEQLAVLLEKDSFIEKAKIQVVAHSPLKRARQTSEGMLNCVASRVAKSSSVNSNNFGRVMSQLHNNGDDDILPEKKVPTVSRVLELPCLMERTPMERLNQVNFYSRIQEFGEWLRAQPEDRIAVVGHSLFFKIMLGLPFKFNNCDVWEVRYSPDNHSHDFDVHWEEHNAEDPFLTEGESFDLGSQNDVTLNRGWSGLKRLYRYDENLITNTLT